MWCERYTARPRLVGPPCRCSAGAGAGAGWAALGRERGWQGRPLLSRLVQISGMPEKQNVTHRGPQTVQSGCPKTHLPRTSEARMPVRLLFVFGVFLFKGGRFFRGGGFTHEPFGAGAHYF